MHSAPQVLQVTIAPVGDYSRYTLTILQPGFDPVFSQIRVSLPPGMLQQQLLAAVQYQAPRSQPAIDYLAKDYDSFRHTIISAMMQRVPAWQPTSEAAFDVVLLDLFSAAADELSNYQDRVMQEAYWATAQKRISLRRHARLMDYFIHEGNQASTVLALNFPGTASYTVPALQKAWTGLDPTLCRQPSGLSPQTPTFVSGLFSSIPLYTWSDAIPSLAAGATQADLAFSSFADATAAVNLITTGQISRLLVEEWLNPATGLARGSQSAEAPDSELSPARSLLTDPLTADPVVRVTWRQQDALTVQLLLRGDRQWRARAECLAVPRQSASTWCRASSTQFQIRSAGNATDSGRLQLSTECGRRRGVPAPAGFPRAVDEDHARRPAAIRQHRSRHGHRRQRYNPMDRNRPT